MPRSSRLKMFLAALRTRLGSEQTPSDNRPGHLTGPSDTLAGAGVDVEQASRTLPPPGAEAAAQPPVDHAGHGVVDSWTSDGSPDADRSGKGAAPVGPSGGVGESPARPAIAMSAVPPELGALEDALVSTIAAVPGSPAERAPHLGSLLSKALRPLLVTLGLWSALAAASFWGNRQVSWRDAYALAWNDNQIIAAMVAVSLAIGALQLVIRLVAPAGRAAAMVLGVLGWPLRKIPLYTRRQIGALIRLVIGVAIVFYIIDRIRSGGTWEAINAGLAQVPMYAPAWLIQGLMFLVFFIAQFLLLFAVLSRGGVHTYLPEEITTTFDSVWGQDQVVVRMREVVAFLKNPERIEDYGGHVPGGVLLWGPPGTGKTLIAEAVAGETSTPVVIVEPAAFQNMFVGIGPMKVKQLYRKLRKLSETYGGVVVFFDEADVLGSRGGRVGGSAEPAVADRQDGVEARGRETRKTVVPGFGGDLGVLNAILASMQGVRAPRGAGRRLRRALGLASGPGPKHRILHIMATNMPGALDPALLRPGRIDRMFRVGFPSKDGRRRTFEGYLAKVPHALTGDQIDELAAITPNATGAIIKDIVNESLIVALGAGRERIEWADVLTAKRLKEHGPPEGVEYVPFERHAVAIHESCHAVVAWKLRRHLSIDSATIEKGQNYLGMVASVPNEDLYTRWKSEYRIDIAVALSSLAGERLFFSDSTSGVAADLDFATKLATSMVGRWGMDDNLSADLGEEELKAKVESLLGDIFAEVRALLDAERTRVLALAHALEVHRTLSGSDVTAVLEYRHGPLVDGTRYDHPDAAGALESYHRAMVDSRSTPDVAPDPEDVLTADRIADSAAWPSRES